MCLCTTLPLSPGELYLAVKRSSSGDGVKDIRVPSGDVIYRYLMNCSRVLIEYTKAVPTAVQFVYETIRTFLSSSIAAIALYNVESAHSPSFDGLAHEAVKQGCLRCLNKFPNLISTNGSDVVPITERPPAQELWLYAACNVFTHANEAQRLGFGQVEFLDLFRDEEGRCKQHDILSWRKPFTNPSDLAPLLLNEETSTLLYRLTCDNCEELFNVLMDKWPQKDLEAHGGPTGAAIHAASEYGCLKIARQLLELGASPCNKNVEGFYPLDIAIAHS